MRLGYCGKRPQSLFQASVQALRQSLYAGLEQTTRFHVFVVSGSALLFNNVEGDVCLFYCRLRSDRREEERDWVPLLIVRMIFVDSCLPSYKWRSTMVHRIGEPELRNDFWSRQNYV